MYKIVCSHDLGLQQRGASKVQNPLDSCNRSKIVACLDLCSRGEQLSSVDRNEVFTTCAVLMVTLRWRGKMPKKYDDVGVLKCLGVASVFS